MPFVIKDVLQHKRNERQIRAIHEREYTKYISNLRRQTCKSSMSYLPIDHMKEIERSRLRNISNKQNQYERIKKENDLLSERLFHTNRRSMIDNQNLKYQQNFEPFYSKRFQQRLNEHKRIENQNHLLIKRINNVHGQLINKQQCEQDWQRHIHFMKKTCDYPENIDRFVSNQHRRTCRFDNIKRSSQLTEHPLAILLGASE
jgi:hypothetical protein